jgi:hypothetical protein
MPAFQSSIKIEAPVARVWQVLTDGPSYPQWNSTVDRIEGAIAAGAKITVHAKISPGRAFPLTVREFVPNSRMVWSSSMPFGLFTGERTFTLSSPGPRQTVFDMREAFTGWLAPLITRSIPDLQPAFDAFAADLKVCAEKQ